MTVVDPAEPRSSVPGPAATSAPATPDRTARRSRAVVYLLMRTTGVVLAVLVLGHFVVTHITTDVANTGVGFVTRRWGSALWLVWDSLMLTAGIAHAGCGMWVVVNDHTTSPRARRATHSGLVALCAVLVGVGLALVVAAAG